MSGAKCRLFTGSTITISRFGGRSSDGQHSLVSFSFAVHLLTVPPCPAICKSGGTCPRFVRYGVGATDRAFLADFGKQCRVCTAIPVASDGLTDKELMQLLTSDNFEIPKWHFEI